jgi:hypothetical protein
VFIILHCHPSVKGAVDNGNFSGGYLCLTGVNLHKHPVYVVGNLKGIQVFTPHALHHVLLKTASVLHISPSPTTKINPCFQMASQCVPTFAPRTLRHWIVPGNHATWLLHHSTNNAQTTTVMQAYPCTFPCGALHLPHESTAVIYTDGSLALNGKSSHTRAGAAAL